MYSFMLFGGVLMNSKKEAVLWAIYQEYEKGNSDMRRTVRSEQLKLDDGSFNQEIQALQFDGLIRGAVLVRDRYKDFPDQVILNRVALTQYGLHYLKTKLLRKTGCERK